MARFYVTTPIYYVNDEPHIGHAYTTVLADVLAGYHRLLGDDVHFLTGTDEHGQKLQEAAKKNNCQPLEYCDRMVVRFRNAWRKLNVTYSDFIRTTEDRHRTVVQKILQSIYDKGEIYADDYQGWYCIYEERFWTEKDLVDGNCPDCHRQVSRISEKNYFFRMSKYQEWLISYIEKHPEFIQPDFRRNEVLGFLKQPLGDLCISRPKSRLSWGIELPFDKSYVCYVWFDALINYISAVGYLSDDGRFEKWWPAVHLIGKDILTTHAVYWPCMLKAIGVKMPKTIFAHGWWLAGQTKMSKSLGNVVRPLELADRYGVDPFRYFLIRDMALGHDATYTEDSFVERYNSDLANDLGNLLSRLAKMVRSYTNGIIPSIPPGEDTTSDRKLPAKAEQIVKSLPDKIAHYKLNQAMEDILELVRETNRYIEENRPWELAKKGRKGRLDCVLYNSAESLRLVSVLLSPVMPEKCAEIRRQLGIQNGNPGENELAWGGLRAESKMQPGKPLFPRLQKPKPAQGKPISGSATAKGEVGFDGLIALDYLAKVQLKTAKVVGAEKVKGADRLLLLKIDLGGETRQIVAGIAKYYPPEQMIGRTLVVVSNLKPARIKGIESKGMLLAAKSGDRLVLLTTDKDIPPGATIS